jgi:hypothetical protein
MGTSNAELPPAPRKAPVPKPNVSELPAKKLKANRTRRSERGMRERWAEASLHRAKQWLANVPSFTLANTNLADMEKQPKNRPKDIEIEMKKMDEMASQKADACSGRWFDQSGRLMVAVYADHIVPVSEFSQGFISLCS